MDKSRAEFLSANSFLNAYLREMNDWEVRETPQAWRVNGFTQQALVVPLGHEEIWVGLAFWSQCGRHRFTMPAFAVRAQSNEPQALDFLALAAQLVENASAKNGGSGDARDCFLERITESHQNIQWSVALREGTLGRLFHDILRFQESEQGLITGHSVHPAPKVRQPMTQPEAQLYGPDGGNSFPLIWLAVPQARIHYQSADNLSLNDRIQQLVTADANWPSNQCGLNADLAESHQLLPAHPWQLERLKAHPQLQQAFATKQIVVLGENGSSWYATSSMRSLYAEALPYMLKFSMSVRLTNSVRHLQPAEAERGCLISHVLATEAGREYANRFEQFTIMEEPAYTCLLSEEGEPILESMMVFRENPIQAQADQDYELLATLCQDHPDSQIEPTLAHSRVANLIKQRAQVQQVSEQQASLDWFDGYLHSVLKPLILAQADYGMLFGAHQQNIVLKLKDGIPVHCYFRDCQGTGFSEVGANLFRLDQEQLGQNAENQLNDDMANKLFAYYLIINSTFSLVSTLGADGVIEETLLLARLQQFLKQLLSGERKDTRFLEYVLFSEKLWQKGNFVCSLADLNENTLADPLSIYVPIENPLYGLTQPNTLEKRS